MLLPPKKYRPALVLLLLLGTFFGCWLIYTATPRPDLAALAGKTPEEYTMGELEYLLVKCLNEGEQIPYRIGTFRFQRLEQDFTQDMTTWEKPPLSRILASPLHEEFSTYLYRYAAARTNTIGRATTTAYWRVLRPYTLAELRQMSSAEFCALLDS